MADWAFAALGAAFFAGLTAILAKLGVQTIAPAAATLVRTVVIVVLTAVVVGLRREWPQADRLTGTGVMLLVLSGLTTGLSWLCYFRALQRGPVSLVAPLDKLSLVMSVLLAVLVLGERLSIRQWFGAGIMTAGAVLLALP